MRITSRKQRRNKAAKPPFSTEKTLETYGNKQALADAIRATRAPKTGWRDPRPAKTGR